MGKIPTSGAACLEMIRQLRARGAVFAEVEVSHYPRLYGHSQFESLLRTFYQFCGLLVRAWLPSRALTPPAGTETAKDPIPAKMLPLEE